MYKFDINCDVGEGLNNEADLLPFIQSCNIACGGHAGGDPIMRKVVSLAIEHQVKIGAHPSYPDKKNFGRFTLDINFNDLKRSIQSQINELFTIVTEQKGKLNHIKPHGALYNDIVKNEKLALFFLDTISSYKSDVKLFVPYGSVIALKALEQNFLIEYEAFADRNYNDDLSLVFRANKNALITNPNKILNHILYILNSGKVKTITGKKVKIMATTFCVHSDTNNAVEIVKLLHDNNSI